MMLADRVTFAFMGFLTEQASLHHHGITYLMRLSDLMRLIIIFDIHEAILYMKLLSN